MSGFRTGVGGLGKPAFGELPIARQPRARWPLPKPVLDFVEGHRAVLVHVTLGDGVGDTLVIRTSASQSKSAGVSWSRTAVAVPFSAHGERRSAREKCGAP